MKRSICIGCAPLCPWSSYVWFQSAASLQDIRLTVGMMMFVQKASIYCCVKIHDHSVILYLQSLHTEHGKKAWFRLSKAVQVKVITGLFLALSGKEDVSMRT